MKKAKAIDARESTITKRFAEGLRGSTPPIQKVKPA